MSLPQSHPDFWTQALQFTPTVHRDVYPALDPSSEKLRQAAQGKVVIVTGAGSGFGLGACSQWVKAGAKAVVLSGRSSDVLERAAESLRAGGATSKIVAVTCDVSSPSEVETLFEKVTSDFGAVDVVVHCAGVIGPLSNIVDAPVDAWSAAFDINLKGTFLVARALARSAGGKTASFVHAGTAASYFASAGQSSYTTSKAASNMVLDQLHVENDNLRVFNVHPGMAKSPVLRKELELYARDSPELFGSLSVYLAGSSADFLRGRFVAANWDVDELERHRDEIVRDGLLQSQPFKGNIGPGGHKFMAS